MDVQNLQLLQLIKRPTASKTFLNKETVISWSVIFILIEILGLYRSIIHTGSEPVLL